ncbi:MAG: hypothetical protein ABJD75_16550 [Parasphingorhabdus sp.]
MATDTQVTLIELIESIVAELEKEADYEEYRSITEHFREPYYVEGQVSPLHRNKPNPLWPKKLELIAEVNSAFQNLIERQGWEVRSQPNNRLLLRRELEGCKLDIYGAGLKRGSTIFSNIHLSRKLVNFETLLMEQFEIEAANTPPGIMKLEQIFENSLERCNSPFQVRRDSMKRIIKKAKIDDAHRRRGPKPNVSRTN